MNRMTAFTLAAGLVACGLAGCKAASESAATSGAAADQAAQEASAKATEAAAAAGTAVTAAGTAVGAAGDAAGAAAGAASGSLKDALARLGGFFGSWQASLDKAVDAVTERTAALAQNPALVKDAAWLDDMKAAIAGLRAQGEAAGAQAEDVVAAGGDDDMVYLGRKLGGIGTDLGKAADALEAAVAAGDAKAVEAAGARLTTLRATIAAETASWSDTIKGWTSSIGSLQPAGASGDAASLSDLSKRLGDFLPVWSSDLSAAVRAALAQGAILAEDPQLVTNAGWTETMGRAITGVRDRAADMLAQAKGMAGNADAAQLQATLEAYGTELKTLGGDLEAAMKDGDAALVARVLARLEQRHQAIDAQMKAIQDQVAGWSSAAATATVEPQP